MASAIEIGGLVKRYDAREVVRGDGLNVPTERCFSNPLHIIVLAGYSVAIYFVAIHMTHRRLPA